MHASFRVVAAVMSGYTGSLGCSTMICVLPFSLGRGTPDKW